MSTMNSVVAVFAALVVVTAGASVAGAATADEPLDVAVAQQSDTGTAVVTVTQNDTTVANATVTVDSETPYVGNGTYETNENGTVVLPAPNESVTVNVTAATDRHQTVETVDLVPVSESLSVSVTQNVDGTATVAVDRYETAVANATVTVESGGNYTGTGSYETGADGTVGLDAPTENVTVEVTATAPEDANQTATTTATLTADRTPTFKNFGQQMSFFVQSVFGSGEKAGGIGHEVSEFVKKNNPGKGNGVAKEKPDHPGKGNPGLPGDTGRENGRHGEEKSDSPGKKDAKDRKTRGNGHGTPGNDVVSGHLSAGLLPTGVSVPFP